MTKDEMWCGNAHSPEKAPELSQTPNCKAIGTITLDDPAKSWSGVYCPECAAILIEAGWTEPVTPQLA